MATTIDLRYKSLLNYSPKQASSCVKLFVWILRKESVLFKQIAKHAEKNILKREQKKWSLLILFKFTRQNLAIYIYKNLTVAQIVRE